MVYVSLLHPTIQHYLQAFEHLDTVGIFTFPPSDRLFFNTLVRCGVIKTGKLLSILAKSDKRRRGKEEG